MALDDQIPSHFSLRDGRQRGRDDETLMQGSPPPPPPDPVAVAEAQTEVEKGQKGQEKTTKTLAEKKRKHAVRAAWRKKNQDALAKIKAVADGKLAKEAALKAKYKAERDADFSEIQAKQKKVKDHVTKLKKSSAKRIKELRNKNKEKEADMQNDIKSAEKKRKEDEKALLLKVKKEVTTKKGTESAQKTLGLAKITKESGTKLEAVNTKLAAKTAVINQKLQNKISANKKEATEKMAYLTSLDAKTKATETALAKKDELADKAATVKKNKELATKQRKQQKLNNHLERYNKGFFPGANRVRRLERRQERQTQQIGRVSTRLMKRRLRQSKHHLVHMLAHSADAFKSVGKNALEDLNKAAKVVNQNKPSNTLVADAWGLALGGKATKAEEEALEVARPEENRLDIALHRNGRAPKELVHAWEKAVGEESNQNKKKAKPVPQQTRRQFAEALGLDQSSLQEQVGERHAQNLLQGAWAGAIGRSTPLEKDASVNLATEATGFRPGWVPPPHKYPDLGNDEDNASPAEDMDAELAAQIGVDQAGHPFSLHSLQELPGSHHPATLQEDQEDQGPEQAAADAVEKILEDDRKAHSNIGAQLGLTSTEVQQLEHAAPKSQPKPKLVAVSTDVNTTKQLPTVVNITQIPAEMMGEDAIISEHSATNQKTASSQSSGSHIHDMKYALHLAYAVAAVFFIVMHS